MPNSIQNGFSDTNLLEYPFRAEGVAVVQLRREEGVVERLLKVEVVEVCLLAEGVVVV